MKKLALFDFDKTLIGIDSVTSFYSFVNTKFNIIPSAVDNELNKIVPNELKNILNKINWLKPLYEIEYAEYFKLVEDFVEERVLNNILIEPLQLLFDLQKNGYDIIILSASYHEIIQVFCTQRQLHDVKIICTNLKFEKNRFTGEFDGLNCSSINKLIKLKSVINLDEYNLADSYALTDHISDLPILCLVGNRYVVHLPGTLDDWSKYYNVKYIQIK